MQVIVTSMRTDSHGRSYMTAKCSAKRIRVPMDHGTNSDRNHKAAAQALVVRMGWLGYGAWNCGGLPNSADRAWVCTDKHQHPDDTFSA